eukprot:13783599-Alexandrium_andersonii.AAC.1
MSASLVGSEMCIRDSPGGCEFGDADGSGSRTSGMEQPTVADVALQQSSVSYTHLTLPTICSV